MMHYKTKLVGRKRGMIMFEFMYAKKINNDMVNEIIDKYKDDYFLHISHKANGDIEIFIGTKRKESEN